LHHVVTATVHPRHGTRVGRTAARKEPMMPNPLAPETCIYLEAIAGDGGVHNSAGTWWLSPDVELNPPGSGLPADQAVVGQNNTVNVRVHKKNNCALPDTTGVGLIDLYVCDPSVVVPRPNDPAHATKITNTAGRPN